MPSIKVTIKVVLHKLPPMDNYGQLYSLMLYVRFISYCISLSENVALVFPFYHLFLAKLIKINKNQQRKKK